MAKTICKRLRLPRRDVERVVFLVRMHMSFSGVIEKKTLRRWIGRYGREWVNDLIALGRADWGASGWRGDVPDLDAVERSLDEVVSEGAAFTTSDLAVDGYDVMEIMGWEPGPAVGQVIQKLYDLVLESPEMNEKDRLLHIVRTQGESWVQDVP